MQTHDTPEKAYDLERLIFFSDGVFAIVITLLVIELHPPTGWDRTLASLWALKWRSLLAYAASFAAVGAYWNAHRRLFARVTKFHPGLVLFNLLLLGLVVLLPFVAELIFESGPSGEPFAAYLGLIAIIGAAQALLWAFAAFIGKVVDARMGTLERVIVLVAMLLVPIIIGGAAYTAWLGAKPIIWLWTAPLMFLANRARRQLLAGEI